MSAVWIGRAFSPENRLGNPTQGVALGWYETGPLALGIRQAPRAKGASPYQPGASPQEWNHPTKRRAESPIQGVAGCAVAHQFRGVTEMVTNGMGRAFSPWNVIRLRYLGRCPRLVWGGPLALKQCAFRIPGALPQAGIKPGLWPSEPRAFAIPGAMPQAGIGPGLWPSEPRAFRIPGAMPQAGIEPGLWPSKTRHAPQAEDLPVSCAPTAQPHTSLGHRPRNTAKKPLRAESPTHLAAPCLNRSRIS